MKNVIFRKLSPVQCTCFQIYYFILNDYITKYSRRRTYNLYISPIMGNHRATLMTPFPDVPRCRFIIGCRRVLAITHCSIQCPTFNYIYNNQRKVYYTLFSLKQNRLKLKIELQLLSQNISPAFEVSSLLSLIPAIVAGAVNEASHLSSPFAINMNLLKI